MEAIKIDINDWRLNGGGAQSDSYFDKATGNYFLKLFHSNQAVSVIEDELKLAMSVHGAGIPSPEPGSLVTDGERFGIIYIPIKNKISFCSLVGRDPDRLEDTATRFADMTKALHRKAVDTSTFRPATEQYRRLLDANVTMDTDMKTACDRILSSMESSKARPCYVHGDLHFGNVITDGVRDYFIDLGGFSYGDPLIDDSLLYFVCNLTQEHMIRSLFHMDCATGRRFWDVFKRRYFDHPLSDDDSYLDLYAPYLLLRTLIFERELGNDEFNVSYRKMFMDRMAG